MNKLVVALAMLVAGASAYTAPTMMARGRASAKPVKAEPTLRKSEALPWATTTLDGTMVGDVGFDPLGLSINEEYMPYGSIKWFREAELQHGRVAQVAWLGFIFPNIYNFGSDANHNFAETNALAALTKVPGWGIVQIAIFIGALEYQRFQKFKSDAPAGDFGLGQGGFNPFGFQYTEEEYADKQLQEMKHGRLAMLAILGVWWQGILTGVGISEQIGFSFARPDYVAKAGYYFPDGI